MILIERLLRDELFDRLNNTVRWNGMSRIKDETVGSHSYLVTLYSRFLAEEIFKESESKLLAITYALLHDFDEVFTGDVLHYVKYNPMNGSLIREALDQFINHEIENEFNQDTKSDRLLQSTLLKQFPVYITKIVKLADWLSMYFYLKKELDLGNTNANKHILYCVDKTKLSILEVIKALNEGLQPEEYEIDVLLELKNMDYE